MEDVEQFHEKPKEDSKDEKKKRPVIKTPVDLQRLKVEKLMKNPDKPIIIPEPSRGKDFMLSVPNFVRNVMGSSAGAGSGEFHVYRHLRRKEYARQKYIQSKSLREQLDEDYHNKLERNRLEAEAKTAKKRAKRLKKKQKQKQKERGGKKMKYQNKNDSSQTESNNDDDDDNSENENSPSEEEHENKNIENNDSNSSSALNKNLHDENTNSSCNTEDHTTPANGAGKEMIEIVVPNKNEAIDNSSSKSTEIENTNKEGDKNLNEENSENQKEIENLNKAECSEESKDLQNAKIG